MPIFYNFHILLATFYIIFGTNILIQCPVPVPVCCMFYVSQKPNIKRNPNGIKTDRELFWNIWEFIRRRRGAWGHQCGHNPPWRVWDPGAPWWVVPPSGHPEVLLWPNYYILVHKKSSKSFVVFGELSFLHKNNTTVVLLKTASARL